MKTFRIFQASGSWTRLRTDYKNKLIKLGFSVETGEVDGQEVDFIKAKDLDDVALLVDTFGSCIVQNNHYGLEIMIYDNYIE